jgi:hypothetical protein
VGSRPRADDDYLVVHPSSCNCDLGDLSRVFRILLKTGGGKCCDRKAGYACAEKSSPEGRGKQLGGIEGGLSD